MKEILFRAKRIDNGEWVEGYYVKVKDYLTEQPVHVIMKVYNTLFPRNEFTDWCEVDPETIGRLVNDPCYTDYTDQRYFEGDIIELYSAKRKFDEKRFGIVVDEHCFTENGLGRCFPQDTLQAKVIGNVWDNPELVGKKYADLYKYYHGFESTVTSEDLKRNLEEGE